MVASPRISEKNLPLAPWYFEVSRTSEMRRRNFCGSNPVGIRYTLRHMSGNVLTCSESWSFGLRVHSESVELLDVVLSRKLAVPFFGIFEVFEVSDVIR